MLFGYFYFSPFIGGEEINFIYRPKFLISVQIVIKKKFLKGLLNLRNIVKSAISKLIQMKLGMGLLGLQPA